MNYNEFIAEIKLLLDEGRSLFNKDATHRDPQFRKWRHRLSAALAAIENQNYSIDCDVTNRRFDIFGYGSFTKRDRIETYNRDLQDTLNELETIVEHFGKYGDPKAITKSILNKEQQRKELEWPQNITLSWLWGHAPISLWGWFIGILIAVFSLGVTTGQSPFFAQLKAQWKTETVDTSASNKVPKPAR